MPVKGYKLEKFKKVLLSNPLLSPTEVAMQVYDCKDRLVARVIASQSLSKINISLKDLLNKTSGLTDEDDLEDLARLRKAKRPIGATILVDKEGKLIRAEDEGVIEVVDNHIQIKALELTLKLKGYLKEEKTPPQSEQNHSYNIIHYGGNRQTRDAISSRVTGINTPVASGDVSGV